MDRDEVYLPIIRFRKLALTVILITSICVIIISFFIAKSITGPISKLHEGVEMIGAGNLNIRVGIDTTDEIGRLSRTFDQMAERLAAGIDRYKRTEERIKVSLKEKEALLREIHHRVKNNLQIISSLLDMSVMRTENQQAAGLITEARDRVHTMSLVHSQL